jgi:transcriptional regulator with XRE-family HTH domain
MLSVESKEYLISLGKRLRILRIKKGDKQAVFAERLGVSIPTYRKMESGHPTVMIGTWIECFWVLDRLGEIDALLQDKRSLFDRVKDQKEPVRQRVRGKAP